MTFMRALGLLLVSFMSTFTGRPMASAQDSPPIASLPVAVATIALAIESGDTAAVVATLRGNDGLVVRTAYPGDGIRVAADVAREEITTFFGTGTFQLTATWRPSVRPTAIILVASGGDEVSAPSAIAITVEEVRGTWSVTAYGRILNLQRTLDQFASQGELRTRASPPGPPDTGSGVSRGNDPINPLWGGFAVLVLGSLVAAFLARRSELPPS